VGDTGQRETGDADSWLRKRGRSTDFTGCVQIEKSGTLLFFWEEFGSLPELTKGRTLPKIAPNSGNSLQALLEVDG
jgi:hypothetical protein